MFEKVINFFQYFGHKIVVWLAPISKDDSITSRLVFPK